MGSLRSLLASIRALSADGSSGRLSVSISPGDRAAVAAGGAQAASAGEAQPLLSGEAGHAAAVRAAEGGAGQAGPALVLSGADGGPAALEAGGGGAGGGGVANEQDLAAAAERYRLGNLHSSVDLRATALALERGLPYVTLLLFLFISSHIVGLAVFGLLSYVLHRLNTVLRAQVALKQERRARLLLGVAGAAALLVLLSLCALHSRDMAGNLVLAGMAPPSKFWEVVFAVVVCDTLLRYLAVVAKVFVLLAMRVDSPARFRRRGQVLTAVEYGAALYRQLPPAPLWYNFFNQAAGSSILATGLSGAYLLVKAQQFFERAALAAMAVQQVAVRGYGSTPSSDEVQEAGNSCPICQEAFREPVRLSCNHIFCSDCCGEWFERERTCPMCRAAVGPASKKFKSKSDGSTPLFPTIF